VLAPHPLNPARDRADPGLEAIGSRMPSDERRQEPAQPAACATARKLIRAFVDNELSQGQDVRLRLHLKSCVACHTEYVELVDSVARIHSQLKALRELDRGELASGAGQRRILDDEAEPVRPRGFLARGRSRRVLRGSGIVILLATAVVFVAVCWPEQPVRSLIARSTGGRIAVGNGAMVDSGEQIEWVRGQWCDVRPGSTARLYGPRGEIAAEGPALVLLESPDPVRVRLQKGELRLQGDVNVTHEHAVVEFAAAQARASVIGTVLEISCTGGSAAIRTSNGATEIEAGQSARVAADGTLELGRAAMR
jgi:hypothetical protein